MSKAHYHQIHDHIEASPAASTAYTTNAIDVTNWYVKSIWVTPEGNSATDCTVDILGWFRGQEGYLPFKSYSGGVASVDEIFGVTLVGDALQKIKVRVTTSGTEPDTIRVLVCGGRSEN